MADQTTSILAPGWIVKNSDMLLAVVVVGVLIVMIIPLPAGALDILLTFNITFSLMVLLVTMYTLKPLDFSVFPSLLLIATLIRLGLNVATTRRILLYGDIGPDAAGKVIQSFGYFVVGGSYVVGIIVFTILVLINFIVITKGATRVAEVAARFTLDALPGKQMSIDADLNAGLIDEQTARFRRSEITREADFYGAMDGASKFVRGDAVAGIVITFINILGGLVIGILQKGMTVGEAGRVYTVLTVGDGLVSQIPALLVSTSAGLIVTRAASKVELGGELTRQILNYPRAIALSSVVLFFFGMIGLPRIPFFVLGTLTGIIAYITFQAERSEKAREVEEKKKVARVEAPERVESLLAVDILELEVGYGLIPLVDAAQGGELLDRIKAIRRQFALEMGIIVPPIHIRDNLQLKPNEYAVLVKGVEVARSSVMMNCYLAMDPGTVEEKVEGTPTKDPAFGLNALWINENTKEKAVISGYMVVDVATVMATHITEIVRTHAYELLGRQDVQRLLDNLSERFPKVVEELVPKLLSLGEIHKVLQKLVREQITIRDLVTILETLADFAPITKDTELLTEYVRQNLKRVITKQYLSPQNTLPCLTLEPKLEEFMTGSIQESPQGGVLALEPAVAQKVISSLSREIEKFITTDYQPVLITSPGLRRHLKNLIDPFIPNLVILSYSEIDPKVKLENLAVVKLEEEIVKK